MARRRQVPGTRFATRRVQNLSWAGLQIPATSLGVDTKVILGSFVLGTEFDETMMRLRGVWLYIGAANAASQAAVGMIVVSDDAFTVGISAIPGPISDIDNDGWVYWQGLVQGFDAVSHVPGVFDIDNKGKRVVRQGSRIALIAEGGSVGVGLIRGFVRLLAMFRS